MKEAKNMNKVMICVMLSAILLGSVAWSTEIEGTKAEQVGQPVRIVSLCFHGKDLDEIVKVIDREGAKGADLIILPELWRGLNEPETLEGETINAMAQLSKKHQTYIVCPIDRQEGKHRYNSAVLIDRQGKVACVYDKVYPYWSEFNSDRPVAAGQKDIAVYETDFGKIGFAICFDAKFPEVWKRLGDKGAELVIWPSVYSGGTELQAFALQHHYYIVTSTYTRDCLVYDITGKCILDQKDDGDITIARFTLDMDRRIYHYNFNRDKRDKLLSEHGDEIEEEVNMPREEWFVLKANKPGVRVRDLAGKYGLEELRDYKSRSRKHIDELRGFSFADKFASATESKAAKPVGKRKTVWGGEVDADYEHAPKESVEKWQDWRFGLRIHWGPYSLVDGHESWILTGESTPEKIALRRKYQELYKSWNPTEFDADEWMEVIKKAGGEYFTFTTKHHDGFSMYDTKTRVKKRFRYDEGHVGEIEDCDLAYSIMETPFGRDVVKELTDAANQHGIGIGLYFSHIDWYDADFRIDKWHWLSDKDYTRQSDPDGWNRMVQRHRTQIREILSNYGPINLVSLDMEMRGDFWPDMLETIKIARKTQPDVMFRKRGVGDYGDYSTPEGRYGATGKKRPWQVIYPCGGAFSYRAQDYEPDGKINYKPKSWILNTLIDSVAKGGNFQVAFGPMPNGKWPKETIEWLSYTGDWLRVNGEAIYKTRAWKYDHDGENVRFTRSKDNKYIYAIATEWPGEELRLSKVLAREGSNIVMLGYKGPLGPKPLKWHQENDGLVIEIPSILEDEENRPCVQAWVFRIQGQPRESAKIER